jgi:predicted HTH transcriptional regulator
VVPDGSVNEQALKAVLGEQAEAPNLEYKQIRDLDHTEGVVKLARDVAAMQSQGGYIVIGVDGRGLPSDTLTLRHVELFDEATVRKKLEKYIPAPIDLRIACHPVNGAQVALIYVPKRRSGFTVMRAPGEYEKDGKKTSLFARGDIFIRTGTSSERVTQETLNQRVLALLEEASSPAESSVLEFADLPGSVELEQAPEIWSMRRPPDFNPPGDAGALAFRTTARRRTDQSERTAGSESSRCAPCCRSALGVRQTAGPPARG